jgi:hypothetical protein
MSDESEKNDDTPEMTGGKNPPQNAGNIPEDVVAPIDGEIDLARLAPQLRGLYQELLAEPIPDRFTRLLEELAGKEIKKQ